MSCETGVVSKTVLCETGVVSITKMILLNARLRHGQKSKKTYRGTLKHGMNAFQGEYRGQNTGRGVYRT